MWCILYRFQIILRTTKIIRYDMKAHTNNIFLADHTSDKTTKISGWNIYLNPVKHISMWHFITFLFVWDGPRASFNAQLIRNYYTDKKQYSYFCYGMQSFIHTKFVAGLDKPPSKLSHGSISVSHFHMRRENYIYIYYICVEFNAGLHNIGR